MCRHNRCQHHLEGAEAVIIMQIPTFYVKWQYVNLRGPMVKLKMHSIVPRASTIRIQTETVNINST